MCNYADQPKKSLDLNLQEEALYGLRAAAKFVADGATADTSSPIEHIRLRGDISQARRDLDYYRLKEEYLTLRVRISKHQKAIKELQKELDS